MDLERFVQAQSDGVFEQALTELHRGKKQAHWMWFVFPQFVGLGNSPTSRVFALSSLEEARRFLRHPLLGARLLQCCRALGRLTNKTAVDIFGPIDAVKLRSSMTLFLRAEPQQTLFKAVIDEFFDGELDPLTDQLLGDPRGTRDSSSR
ncbi:MAG: DUF1810 domain-containing protein [Acidimicrobiales bacterium]